MTLNEIVQNIGFENTVIECIAILDRNKIEGWLKTVSGFANNHGGTFYIGVEDKTNKLIGFSQKDADNERNYFNNQVNEHIYPRPKISFDFIPYKIGDSERFIIKIDISEALYKPVVLKYNGKQCIYMRRDGFTNGASYEEMRYMFIHSEAKQYDVSLTDKEYCRDDFTKLFAFYREHNNGKEFTDKALQSMGFFSVDVKTNKRFLANGALLFSDNSDGKKTKIYCSTFAGFSKGDARIVDMEKYDGNLIDNLENTLSFIKRKMNHSIIKLNDRHINKTSFPERALLEGIINAIAHRDYYLEGTQISVNLFKDRLEISSPGNFYMAEQLEKTYDLSSIISKRRNELICNILVQCKVMEAAGTGFDKITKDYENEDLNHKPYITSSSDHFTLVLPDVTYDEGVQDNTKVSIESLPITNETAHDYKVLTYCFNESKQAKEIAEYLGLKDSTYFRKHVLDNLVQNGYLIKSTLKHTTYYRTNTRIIKTL